MRGPKHNSRKGLMRRITHLTHYIGRDWYVNRGYWQPSETLRTRTKVQIQDLRKLLDELEAKL